MNDNGQVFLYGLMLGILLIVLALALAPSLRDFTVGAQNATSNVGGQGLDCTNSSISDYDKGACRVTDLTLPYFIGILIGIAGIVISIKVIFRI